VRIVEELMEIWPNEVCDRYWQRFRTLLEGVGCGWFEHRDMEHRMSSPHGVWKMECEGLQTGLSNYFI